MTPDDALFRLKALAARLGALGLEGVLDHPRVQREFPTTWVTDLEATIDNVVP